MKTLRDYMKEHHPEHIDPFSYGGVCVCPTTVSDFNHLNLKPLCDKYKFPITDTTICTECWDQPYTPPNNIEETHPAESTKTYEDGLDEAWEFARSILKNDNTKIYDAAFPAFEHPWEVITTLFYDEAKEFYDDAIKELNTIEIGDEVEYLEQDEDANKGDKGFIISGPNYDFYYVVLTTNRPPHCCSTWFKKNFHKTGKHNSKLAEVISEITEDPQ